MINNKYEDFNQDIYFKEYFDKYGDLEKIPKGTSNMEILGEYLKCQIKCQKEFHKWLNKKYPKLLGMKK